ncbi:MAG TPA: CRTAC1 family protein [Bacteroidia bacterium]|nr:CRTAC1 family protein [Bacteroidia bacterium]
MKQFLKLTACMFTVAASGSLAAQITFSDQTTLFPTAIFHSGNGIGVCDMNGDKKDDVVRASQNTTQYVEYQGAPNGVFTELSSVGQNIGDPWGMACGDFNNDGFTDVTWGDGWGYTRIMHWNGTNYTATDVTTLTGAAVDFPQGCNFHDINGDGFLDAFTCNDNSMPDIFIGDGTPTGWIWNQAALPLATFPASDNSGNYASIWTDVNNDGYIDLMITHCRQGVTDTLDARRIDQVFINNGNYTYTQDVTNWTGLRDGAQGWSTAWGDIDNDGDMDAFVMNYDLNSKMMINNGSGVFTNAMTASGIANTTTIFGENATFHDFDNDGYVDMLITGDTHILYHNNGNGTFTANANPFPYNAHQATAHAVGDLNNDGKLDVYTSYCDIFQSPSSTRMDKLWMNTTSNGNHYVVFDLVGGAQAGMSNLNGIGAIVKIYGGWGVQVREVRSGEGYGIQNSFAVHFGLGIWDYIDSVVVIWPSGIVDRPWSNQADAHNVVNEGAFPTSAAAATYHPFRMMLGPNPMNAGEYYDVQLWFVRTGQHDAGNF